MTSSANCITPKDIYFRVEDNLKKQDELRREFLHLKRSLKDEYSQKKSEIMNQLQTQKSQIIEYKKMRKKLKKLDIKLLKSDLRENVYEVRLEISAIKDNLKATLRKIDAVYSKTKATLTSKEEINLLDKDYQSYKSDLVNVDASKISALKAKIKDLRQEYPLRREEVFREIEDKWNDGYVNELISDCKAEIAALKMKHANMRTDYVGKNREHKKLVSSARSTFENSMKEYSFSIAEDIRKIQGMQKKADDKTRKDLKVMLKRVRESKKTIFLRRADAAEKRAFRNVNPAYIYLLPAFFGVIVFTLLPFLIMLIASQFQVNFFNLQASKYVGFGNFIAIFTEDVEFQKALSNTIIFAITIVGLLTIVTLSMAAWMSKDTKIHNLSQSMVFTPHIASLVSISILWIAMLHPDGVINTVLEGVTALFGIDFEGPGWLIQKDTSLFAVALVAVWKDIGYYVLIIIAGLQSIPAYVYEAAKLDKARKSTTFFRITIPLLMPTLSFVFVTKFINSFKLFAPIEIMTGGGPLGSSMVLSFWIYKAGRTSANFGHATAGAIVLTIIIACFTFVNHRFMKKSVKY